MRIVELNNYNFTTIQLKSIVKIMRTKLIKSINYLIQMVLIIVYNDRVYDSILLFTFQLTLVFMKLMSKTL